MNVLIILLIGGIAGWLAGVLMSSPQKWWMNIIIGLIGGVIGSIVLKIFGITGHGFIGGIIVSVIGSCILIFIIKQLSK